MMQLGLFGEKYNLEWQVIEDTLKEEAERMQAETLEMLCHIAPHDKIPCLPVRIIEGGRHGGGALMEERSSGEMYIGIEIDNIQLSSTLRAIINSHEATHYFHLATKPSDCIYSSPCNETYRELVAIAGSFLYVSHTLSEQEFINNVRKSGTLHERAFVKLLEQENALAIIPHLLLDRTRESSVMNITGRIMQFMEEVQ